MDNNPDIQAIYLLSLAITQLRQVIILSLADQSRKCLCRGIAKRPLEGFTTPMMPKAISSWLALRKAPASQVLSPVSLQNPVISRWSLLPLHLILIRQFSTFGWHLQLWKRSQTLPLPSLCQLLLKIPRLRT